MKMTEEEKRLFDNLVGAYFGWRHDITLIGDGARIALTSVICAMNWQEEALKELARLEKEFPTTATERKLMEGRRSTHLKDLLRKIADEI